MINGGCCHHFRTNNSGKALDKWNADYSTYSISPEIYRIFISFNDVTLRTHRCYFAENFGKMHSLLLNYE